MILDTAISVVAALGAAAAFATATVAMHHATAHTPEDVSVLSGAFRSPLWWSGIGLNAVAYVLQGVALAFGPLVLVQPLLVLALVFTLAIGARVVGGRLSASAWWWSALLIAALAVFVVGLAGAGTKDRPPVVGPWAVAVAVTLLVAVGAVVAARRTGAGRAVALAAVAGVLAGIHAVLTKVVVDRIGPDWTHVLVDPAFIGLVVIGFGSLWVRQLAFRAEWLHASVPTMTVLEPLVAAAVGVLVLGERVRESGPAVVVLVVTVAVMAVATVALARVGALELEQATP